MSLRDELEEILSNQMASSPVWAQLRADNTTVQVSGPIEETFQTITSALMTYSDALLMMVLRLAEAVDDLRDDAGVKND